MPREGFDPAALDSRSVHPDTPLTVNRPNVIFDVQGAEAVVIDLASGHYFRLDAPSTRLWASFDAAAAPEAVLAACTNRGDLEGGFEAIVTDLLARELLRPATVSDSVGPVTAWEFGGFKLEEFTDLEDILGLDPIHEVDASRGWPHVAEG